MFDRLHIMGILNVTPDSFYDGGKWLHDPIARASQLIEDGVDIIDIGGESSGPNSKDVSLEEELRRVIPVVRSVRQKHPNILISVDTYKSEVARQSIEVGADMINDVTALRGDPKMAEVVMKAGVWLVMMYSKDATVRTTRDIVHYDDVVATIKAFFQERLIDYDKIILDPGMGLFVSADPEYSFEIIERLPEFKSFGRPVMLGPSNKSFLKGKPMPLIRGADILRVHHVRKLATQQRSAS